MHFDIVVKTHSAWRLKLEHCLVHDDVCGMDPAALEHDCKCQIGQWLKADGKLWQLSAEYSLLDEMHKNFHRAVADVVRHVQTGAAQTAAEREALLAQNSAFAQASDAELAALENMHRKIQGVDKPGTDEVNQA